MVTLLIKTANTYNLNAGNRASVKNSKAKLKQLRLVLLKFFSLVQYFWVIL
jgi:hypothetical protein